MGRASILLAIILVAIVILIAGGVFAEPIIQFIRRRIPQFTYDAEGVLLWGLFVVSAFVAGLVVMYSLLRF